MTVSTIPRYTTSTLVLCADLEKPVLRELQNIKYLGEIMDGFNNKFKRNLTMFEKKTFFLV